jgi:stearoyl-CoA desaturase (delta-9 desaturase)
MFPFSARHGLEWWQLDLTWWFLKGLEKVGLVSGLKLPKAFRTRGGSTA